MPGVDAPAASRAERKKTHEHSHHRSTGIIRHSRTQWFYGLLRALPGDQALLSPSSCGLAMHGARLGHASPQALAPTLGRQNHTTSPSASAPFVCAPVTAHG
jgi:hypothetical protein